MMKGHRTKVAIALLVGGFLVEGCATRPAVSSRNTERIAGMKRVVLAPPIVEYIDVESGKSRTLDETGGPEVQSALIAGFRSELAAKQVAVLEVSDIPDGPILAEDLGGIYRTLRRDSSLLDAVQRERLSCFAATTETSHVMFCRCRSYVGPGRSWDPFSGAITSGSSRTVLECHLYSIPDEKIVWNGAAQIRASPSSGDSSIATMIALAVESLEVE